MDDPAPFAGNPGGPATAAPAPATVPEIGPAVLPGFWTQAARIATKDLSIEWKSREILFTSGFLAVVVVLVFSFAFVVGGTPPPPNVVAGILWVAILISGVVGLGRAFDRERDGEAVRALLLSPTPRTAIFFGKLAATVALMLAVELPVAVLVDVFFNARLVEHAGRIGLFLALGTIGFAAVGSVFSAALLRSKSRDVLLSTLLYPIVVPLLIAGARGTAHVLDPVPDLDAATFWTQFMGVVDIVFVIVGLWAFEPIITGD